MNKTELSAEMLRMQRELAIGERDFLRFVRDARHLGYGRMMQIIEREWYGDAQRHGRPTSGVLIMQTCLGLLPEDKQAEWVSGYHSDPLDYGH